MILRASGAPKSEKPGERLRKPSIFLSIKYAKVPGWGGFLPSLYFA
jgi:hypothetical protein